MIYGLIQQLAKDHPSQPALVFEGKTYTYRRFLRRIDAAAGSLSAALPEKSSICLLSPNLPDALFLLASATCSGHRILALDKFVSPSEIREVIERHSIQYLMFHESYMDAVTAGIGESVCPVRLSGTDEGFYILDNANPGRAIPSPGWIRRWFSKRMDTPVEENDPCIMFSSSGSSGKPKVFELTQSQFYHQIINVRDNFGFRSSDSALCSLHFSHNHAVCLIFSVIATGGTTHLMPVAEALAPRIIEYISKHRISIFSNVPMIYKAFADLSKHLDTSGLKSLRMAICGSAPLSAQVAELFFEKFGQHLHQSYGLSEIGPVCVNLFEDDIYEYGSVGRIFPQIDHRVVDQNGTPVKPGEEGHLLLKGKSMTNGYLHDDDANAKMFPDEWLHTQDVVRMDKQGNMFIVGRLSNFINVGGLKVYPAEIEKTIMNMEAVREAAVIATEDELFGQVVKAFIVKHDNAELEEADVKAYCTLHLSNYKVPRTVLFIRELPKNAIGKIIGSKLPD